MKSATHTLPSRDEPLNEWPSESVIVNGGTLSYFGRLLARCVHATLTQRSTNQQVRKGHFTGRRTFSVLLLVFKNPSPYFMKLWKIRGIIDNRGNASS